MFVIKVQLKNQDALSYVWGNRFTTDLATATKFDDWLSAYEKCEAVKPFIHLDSDIRISSTV